VAKVSESALSKWSEVIGRQRQSGQSVEDFCSSESINPSTFKYYRAKLSKKASANGKTPVAASGFSKVEVTRARFSSPTVDPKWLAEFVKEFLGTQ
jgi:hypothetical protein